MMKHSDSNLEEMLRDSLGRQADRGAGIGPDLDGVLGRARTIRRHRRQGVAALAAAAVVAITVPTTLYLQANTNASGPPAITHQGMPSVGIASTAPSATASPTTSPSGPGAATPVRYSTLASIPRSGSTNVTYLDLAGHVHSDGTSTKLPGNVSGVTTFHDFRGGWVVYNDNTVKVTQYDASGKVMRSGRGGGTIAVSSDRTMIAWQTGSTLYWGSTNTMGNGGPAAVTAPKDAALIGFLGGNPVLAKGNLIETMPSASGNGTFRGFTPTDIAINALTTSETDDLVGGLTGTVAKGDLQGAVYDVETRTILWRNGWRPVSFSDDGKYVAAYPVGDNGDPASFAILDARTGKILAQTPRLGAGVYLDYGVAWEGHSIVFEGSGGKATQSALLRLSPTGTFSRVSVVATGPIGKAAYRFEAQP